MNDRMSVREADSNVSQQGTQKWSFETDDKVFSSPTIIDGTVYIGSMDGNVYALNSNNGNKKWQFQTGSSVFSSPSVVDGTVYFPSTTGDIYAIDSESGTEEWHYNTDTQIVRSVTVAGETVFVGNSDGIILALDATDGTVRWRYETGNFVATSPTVIDGTVFVGSSDEHMYALDAKTGEKQWQFETISRARSSPTVADGLVIFGGTSGTLYAVDANSGEEEWRTDIWVESTPTILDGTVFVGSNSDKVYALDVSNGSKQWSFNAGRGNSVESSPTVVEDTVFVGSDAEKIHALDSESGDERWRFETNERIYSSPTVVGGTLFVGTAGGNVYAVNTGVSGSSEGSRVRLGTLGHHESWAGRQAEQQSTESKKETPTESTASNQTTNSSTTSNQTAASSGYNLTNAAAQTEVTVGTKSLKVLYGIPDAAIDRFAVTTPRYELVDPDTTRDALLTHWWGERNLLFDWNNELDYAREMRNTYRVTELLNRAASFGWEALEAYALAQVSPGAALGSVLDLLDESIAWAVSEITTPYQETMSKMGQWQLSYTELKDNVQAASSLTDLSTTALGFLDVALALDGVWKSWSAALTAGQTAYSSSPSMTTALSAAGRGAAVAGVYYAALGLVADKTVGAITSGMKQNAELAAIGHGYTVTRIPMIDRIRTLQNRAATYELSPGGAWELSYLIANHHYMSAVANHGMYKQAHALNTSLVGFAWDGLTGVGDAATVFKNRAHTYRRGGIAAHRDLGSGFRVAANRAANSINQERLGDPTPLGGENL